MNLIYRTWMISLDEIIKGCKKYDKAYQHLLYEKYACQMRSICYRYLYASSELDDVVHEGFIKAYVNINQYSGKGSFEGWLKRIFINISLQYNIKSQKTRVVLNIDNFQKKSTNNNLSEVIDNEPDDLIGFDKEDVPADYLEAVQMADFSEKELLDAINVIPEKLRLVFNLYCIEEYSHDEIAKLLQIDVVTSRTRLLRARNFVKKLLYEQCLAKNRIQ